MLNHYLCSRKWRLNFREFRSALSHIVFGASAPQHCDDDTLVDFGDGVTISKQDAFEGILDLGGTGSGKTTSSGYQLASAMLRQRWGGLVLTAKVDEVNRWRKLANDAGRADDLIIFDGSGEHCLDFARYQSEYLSADSDMTENLAALIEELSEVGNRASGQLAGRSDEQFWATTRQATSRKAIRLVRLATGKVSISDLVEVIREAPRSREQASDLAYMRNNTVGLLQIEARRRHSDPSTLHDIEQIEDFFLNNHAGLAEKTRSIIDTSILGVIDLFSSGLLHRLFGHGMSVTPDDVLRGKIVVVNLPVKRYGTLGVVAQTIWKTLFQQRIEQRRPDETLPCFLYIDEAQLFLTRRDMHFAATARSSLCAMIWLTQSMSNVYAVMGGDETGKAVADSLLGLAQTKIFHQNSDPVTNRWAAELIGTRYTQMIGSTLSPRQEQGMGVLASIPQFSTSITHSYEYALQPSFFTSLKKGGRPHGYAEAVIFQGGRIWPTTNDSYCFVRIVQGY